MKAETRIFRRLLGNQKGLPVRYYVLKRQGSKFTRRKYISSINVNIAL